MPRKRASSTLHFKPTAPAHPSLAASRSPSSTADSTDDHSVNKLLADLRNAPRQPRSTDVKSQAPSTSAVIFPPSPRHQLQRTLSPRSRMAERRRARGPPGPRPPPSWSRPVPLVQGLEASVHAPTRRPVRPPPASHKENVAPFVVQALSKVSLLPHLPPSTSLQMIVLARIARYWDWHAANDLEWLAVLPVPVRESLLWALADHGQILDRDAMQALVVGVSELLSEDPEDKVADAPDSWETSADASDTIRRLVIGPSLSSIRAYRWLGDVLAGPRANNGIATLQVSLTHLSLVAATETSWTRLIALAPHLPHLVHLDLAGWPSPESLSGGSVLHSDPREDSARTLRRLGRALSGLQWLGLDGCADWMGAWSVGLDSTSLGDNGDSSGGWSAWDDGNDNGSNSDRATTSSPASASAARSSKGSGINNLPPAGHVDWPRSFYSLRTLRLSLTPNATLSSLLASEDAWKAAVATYTHDASEPFPPFSPQALLRIPEPHPPSRNYEGPRWERAPVVSTSTDELIGHAASRTTYTLQPAHRLPAWRAITGWLGAADAMAELEQRVRGVRRAYFEQQQQEQNHDKDSHHDRRDGDAPLSPAEAYTNPPARTPTTTTPFRVHRSGIDVNISARADIDTDANDAPAWRRDLVDRWIARRKRAGVRPVGGGLDVGAVVV